MMDWYNLLKGLHILAVIAWMAGTLYLPRLFVYHIQNKDKPEVTAVFRVMERKLLRLIINPAMIATWLFGLSLLWLYFHQHWGGLLSAWILVKLTAVLALSGYHGFLANRFKKLDRGEDIGSEKFWRMINEVPFVLAAVIVLSVTLKYGAR
jgi:putative membrane protein